MASEIGDLFGKAGSLISNGVDAAKSTAPFQFLNSAVGGVTAAGKQAWSYATDYAQAVAPNDAKTVENYVMQNSDVNGPLGDLEPETSPFGFEQLQYPIGDLLTRYPYYITFHFNVPTTRSRFNAHYNGVEGDENGNISLLNKTLNPGGTIGLTTRESNRLSGGSAQLQSVPVAGEKVSVDVTRSTFRTSQSVRLYMPDTLQWNFRQQWRDPHLSDSGLVSKLAPLMSIKEGIESGSMSGLTAGVAQSAKLLASKFADSMPGGLPEGVLLASMGYTVNPLIDVIYTSPDLRTFTMEFVFAPRSADEALAVRRIIRAFKFFSAPEVPSVTGYGYLMIPPGDIDIEFSIKTIGKISTCVLQNIDLDYAPNGFAAYQNPQDITDGMPVNIRMRLEFTETEYITKDLVLKGY